MALSTRFAIVTAALTLLGIPENAEGQTVQVTITSDPPNISFTVEGNNCGVQQGATFPSPRTFIWNRTAKCRVRFMSPATVGNTTYILDHWNDHSNANPKLFDPPAENVTLTATLVPAVQLTVGAQCRNVQNQAIPCPAAPAVVTLRGLQPGGSVSSFLQPQGYNITVAGWFAIGSIAYPQVQAAPGFTFLGWIGLPPPLNPGQVPEVPIVMPASPVTVGVVFRKN
jgi:hypothetical protein